ncbi:MAG TPA: exo-alpha-sialidase, partial [Chthonomonadales bacterium]|nr:exo-alpha-sialidase [Chthonomonadales bacterium]
GGVEPVVIERKDGRIWMLIRTQLGRFYESFSKDGVEWTPAHPTNILSSESPAGLIRLKDERILLLWNNCLRFPYAYGGRHVLHAAISDDEGRTWRGCREILRDRFAENPLPSNHDVGVSYPYPLLTKDGKVLFTLWVDTSRTERALTLLDPAWLDETVQKDDFSRGLEQWSVFGTKGVKLATHPEKSGAKVLQIRKTHFDWPAAAVWNFPAGAKGRLRMRIRIHPGFAGALLGLTDHFSVPFDMEDRFYNLFNLEIGPEGQLPGGKWLKPGRWHELQFDWDCDKRECRVSVDGQKAVTLPLTRLTAAGVNYLRLRSTTERTDNAGMLIEYVEADVSKSWPAWQARVTAPVRQERRHSTIR